MTDIEHVLYNTIGTEFEKYLEGKDLMTLSNVSRTTRQGNLTTKFRRLLMATLREYEIFKANNRDDAMGINLNSFLKHIPLGVIYKDYKLEYKIDINLLLDYIYADDETRLYVWIELCYLEDFKEYMKRYNGAKLFHVNTLYHDLLTQGSIRNRPDIVQEVYRLYFTFYDDKLLFLDEYYQGTEELRQVYMKYNSKDIDVAVYRGLKNREEYPIAYDIMGYDESDDEEYDKDDIMFDSDVFTYIHIFLFYATSFQEQDTFKEFYLKYRPKLSKTVERILNDESLKYNIDIYDERLYINYDP